MARSKAPKPLTDAVKDQIVEWLTDHGAGSLTWVSDSVRQYWPRVQQADVKEFLQLDPRIRSFTDRRGATVYGVREALPAVLPPQKPRIPDIELPPFRMNWPPLPEGRVRVTWGEVLRQLPSNLDDLETDYVQIVTEGFPAWNFATVMTDEGLRWICWLVVSGLEASAYMTWRWHAWRPGDLGQYGDDRVRLREPDPDEVVVVTWASSTSLDVMREVTSDLTTRFTDPTRLEIHTVKVDEITLAIRRLRQRSHELLDRALKRSGVRVQSRVIKGYCLMCGMGLSDSESLERGIGPECWRKVNHLDQDSLRRHVMGGVAAVFSREVSDWARCIRLSIAQQYSKGERG